MKNEAAFFTVEGTTKGEVGSRVGRAGVTEGAMKVPSSRGLLVYDCNGVDDPACEEEVLKVFRSGVV